VAISSDGARVLSGSALTIKLWDAATGALIRTFEGHSGAVNSAAFSRDGGRVLSGSRDNTIKLWDADTGALIRTFEGHAGEVNSVAFSPLAFGEHRRGRYSAERTGFGALPAALSSSMICLRHSMPYWVKAVTPSSPMP
jgi:WD40 repeat protein